MAHCRVENCMRPIHLKRDSLCNAHYLQQRAGKPFTVPRNTVPVGTLDCSFAGCDNKQMAKGYCTGHYWMNMQGREMKPLYMHQRKQGSALVRDSQGRKECSRCKEWRDESEYGPHTKNADGLRAECVLCRRKAYERDRETIAAKRILRQFNITVEQRDQMLAEQGGKCATCRTAEPGAKGWCIDHDHSCCPEGGKSCGKCIRGILCMRCNLTLGAVNDDKALLASLIRYLDISEQEDECASTTQYADSSSPLVTTLKLAA